MLGMLEGDVAEQRVDRRQSVVAGSGTVVPDTLEVLQERGDERSVEGSHACIGWERSGQFRRIDCLSRTASTNR